MRLARLAGGAALMLGLFAGKAAAADVAVATAAAAEVAVATGTQNELPALEKITFRTSDGWTIVGDYRPPREGQEVFMLIHSLKGSRSEWTEFADRLARLGLGTLAFDLRGYGESTQGPYGSSTYKDFTDETWPYCTNDIDAAFEFLKERGIEEDAVGMAGAILGANIASMSASRHPEAAWLVLLSPGNNYHGLSVGDAGLLQTLLAAGQDDEASTDVCQDLVNLDVSRTFLAAPAGRGVEMFKDQKFLDRVMKWIKEAARAG
jgi:pimeloyl-ACP methyl ester carboxylesterase